MKNKDFQIVYKKGISYANKYLVMYVLKNKEEENRLGISVSKKVGNSIVRHRITRLVRESYRLHESIFNSGLDIVIVGRPSAATVPFTDATCPIVLLTSVTLIFAMSYILRFSAQNFFNSFATKRCNLFCCLKFFQTFDCRFYAVAIA